MIYDCFTFYNELELLEIRLNILDKFVDAFVLIENIVTYTNQKKPLYFAENKERYKKFKDKIIHIVVRDSPDVSHPWIIEQYLMAAAIRGLKKAKPDDTILISNLDEIPAPEKILEYKDKPGKLKVFEQLFFYYYLNFVCINKHWFGTKMLRYKDFLSYHDAYVIRHSPPDVTISNGGWHFSHMGGIKKIKEKIATGSHQEYNNNKYNTRERIEGAILEKKDIFNHGDTFDIVSLDNLPLFIQKNSEKYGELIFHPKKNSYFKKKYIVFLELKHIMRIMYRNLRAFLKT